MEFRYESQRRNAQGSVLGWPGYPYHGYRQLMRKNDIGAVPIGENDRLIGMVTDRDIVCKGLTKENFDIRRAKARDVMTSGIHCCGEEDDLDKAAAHMEEVKVRRLPVINTDKRMVGVLSRHDIARARA